MGNELDIKDISTYTPGNETTEVLKDDWRIVMAWWSQIVEGREFTYSREQVIDLAALIYEELKKRKINFHPDKMKKNSKRLYEIVSKGQIEESGLEDTTTIDEEINTAFRDLPGLIMKRPHGQRLASGEKSLVVKEVPFDIDNKEFYIVQDDKVYGIVKFNKKIEVEIEDFRKLEEGHLISEAEWKEWWPDAEKLWIYSVSELNKFKDAIRIVSPKDAETFIKKVKFILEDETLANIIRSGEKMGPIIKLKDIEEVFESFYINKPFIRIVGGLANHPEKGTKGDIDILVSAPKPQGDEMLPLIFRLYRMFPKEMWPRIQILWNNTDFEGPFTNYINLYDLKVEKRSDSKKIILMGEEEDISDYEEFQEEATIQDETFTDAVRSKNAKILKEAKTSRETGVAPFRYFEMLKGIAGYRKQETYTPKSAIAAIKLKDYPVEIDEKFDGMRIQIHKKGKKVKILSIDGEDLTNKLPDIVTEAMTQKDSVRDGELTGWTEGYRKGKMIGRSDVAGHMHSKAGLPHKNFFANVFDVVWFEGKDVHNLALSERRKLLDTIKSSDHIKIINMKLAKNAKQAGAAITWASKFPGSEGAMIKSWASKYPLTSHTSKWIKYKKEADLDAEVLAVHKVAKSKAYNYLMILRTKDGTPVPVGRTYNTSIKAKKGDILRVAFGNLNMYTDPRTEKVWYNWVFPRVIEFREDKDTPDFDTTARKANKDTKGEVDHRRYPKRYRDILRLDSINDWLMGYPQMGLNDAALGGYNDPDLAELTKAHEDSLEQDSANQNLVFDANPFLTPGDEEKHWKFVLQNHFRGKSVHADLRMERPSFLVGWTINNQKAGKPSKDISTLKEAKAFSKNKNDVKSYHQGGTDKQQVVMEKKSPQPKQWLTAEGEYAPGEVGATKEHEGVFNITAEGEVEFGAQKPYFHEYFFTAKKGPYKDNYQGRFVVRLLKNVWGPEKGGRGKFTWMGWFAKDEEPYIISSRAVKIGAMPPNGLSWLPRHIRKQIPKEYQYWKEKGAKAKKVRDALVKAMKKEVKINFDSAEVDKAMPEKGKFALSHIGWRGPIVQRQGWSRQEWHLFLEDNGKVRDFIMDQNPEDTAKVPVIVGKSQPISLLKQKGQLKPKSSLNPDKKTPAFLSIIESGNFKLVSEDADLIVLTLKGATLRGEYQLKREGKGSSLWTFSKL